MARRTSGKQWEAARERILNAIDKECRATLTRECKKVLRRFPKAQRVAICDGMGRVWVEIDGLSFHYDDDRRDGNGTFYVTGLRRCRDIRAHRLLDLANTMLEVGDELLDPFKASFPDIEVRRSDL